MTTFKKLKYDSNLKPRFSKGKAPSDEIKPSDDLDINYLHQRSIKRNQWFTRA